MFLRFVEIEGYRAAGRPLRVELPGRLSVIVGGNKSGKTTICDAIYQSFPNKFPSISRPIADTVHDNLGRINLTFEKSGDAPEDSLLGSGVTVDVKVGRKQGKATFVGDFRNALPGEALSKIMAIYLTADRQPVQELGRENSLLIVQLLRTVAADPAFDGDLGELYERAKRLLKLIVEDPLVVELEGRLRERMVSVSGGTANQIPHVGTSAMDQQLLARILELLLGEVSEETGRRLELSGLGYANLLYLAAILTALPRLGETLDGKESPEDGDSCSSDQSESGSEPPDEVGSLESSAGDKADGDIFPRETTLFVLLVEEPEAHLHPQLQAGVLQELRRLVKLLPNLQVILTTHSPEILAMSEPEELVVLPGRRFIKSEGCFALAAPVTLSRLGESMGQNNWEETRRMLRLHLDATRSGAVFADEVMLVEGPTDAVLFRRFGLAWAKASTDPKICASKARFVNALSIVPMNHKVGEWPVRLLASKGFEISSRLAVVRDSDRRPAPPKKGAPRPPLTDEWLDANQPKEPDWLKPYDRSCVDVFELHPTLEPALWRTNSALIELFLPEEPEVQIAESAEEDFGDETLGAPVNLSVSTGSSGKWTVDSVDKYFRSGGGKGKKAITSLQVADAIDSNPSVPLSLPEALSAAFEYLWEGFLARTQPGPTGGNNAEVPEGVPTDA